MGAELSRFGELVHDVLKVARDFASPQAIPLKETLGTEPPVSNTQPEVIPVGIGSAKPIEKVRISGPRRVIDLGHVDKKGR